MTAAQARHDADVRLAHRRKLLDQMELINPQKVLRYAGDHSLPTVFGRWSTEVLDAAVKYLLSTSGSAPRPTPPERTMSPKTNTNTAGRSFIVHFPNKHPRKAVAEELLDGAVAPAFDDDTTSFTVRVADDLKGAPREVLLALVNATRTTPINKFKNDDAAAEAAFQALTTRAEPVRKGAKSAPTAARAPKPVDYKPKTKSELHQVKAGSKVATAIDLLAQERGVLLTDLENELSKTGAKVNARAWLGYDVHSVVGYGVRSEQTDEGLRVFLVLPKGMNAPLAHKVATPKPEPKPTAVQKAVKATKVKADEPVSAKASKTNKDAKAKSDAAAVNAVAAKQAQASA
jgi:hypothetical protein